MKTLCDIQTEHASESALFHEALGKAIGRWASVEWALSRIFWHALGLPDESTSTSAFFSNPTFHGKLQMVHEPFTLRYRNLAFEAKWKTLYNRLSEKSKIRNNLAHAPTTFAAHNPSGQRVYLNVGSFNPAKHPDVTGKARTVYYTRDLFEIEATFTKLANRIGMLELEIENYLSR